MKTTTSLRADARRNRERLLAAAMATFTESGADDSSLEEIARRARVGIGTLYRHFPTRQSLLEAVYRDQVEALCARAEALAQEPLARKALVSWLRALVAFSLSKRTLTSSLLAGKDSALYSTSRTQIHDAANQLLIRAKEAGGVRPDVDANDLLRLSHAVIAATDHTPDQAREADRMLDLVLGGVWE